LPPARQAADDQDVVPEPDSVEFGQLRRSRRLLPRWPGPRRTTARWVAALAVIATCVAVVGLRSHHSTPRHAPVPWYSAEAFVAVTKIRPGLLGEHTRWSLDAIGTGWEPGAGHWGSLVRIQFPTGLITRTRFLGLASDGPVAVIASTRQVLIRPVDGGSGFSVLVSDGHEADLNMAAMSQGGPAFPGPQPGQVWVGSNSRSVLRLVTMTGRWLGRQLQLPGTEPITIPDDHGYLLTQARGGVYDVRPSGARRVASGVLLAIGPQAWLIATCSAARHCVELLTNPLNSARRAQHSFGGLTGYPQPSFPPGPVSPDSRFAALLTYGRDQSAILHLVNLRAGTVRTVDIALGAQGSPYLAWSPDSRWLFAVTGNGKLRVINPLTATVSSLGVALPPVTYLAVQDG
jgi:hypothetical protein